MKITEKMQPMPGHDTAFLPGVPEALREKEWSFSGIPVDAAHRSILNDAAVEFDLQLPF